MTLVAFHSLVTVSVAQLVAAFALAFVTRSSECLQVLFGKPYQLARHFIGVRLVMRTFDAMGAMLHNAQGLVSDVLPDGHGIGVAILRIGDKYNRSIIGKTPTQHLIRNNQEVKPARTFD